MTVRVSLKEASAASVVLRFEVADTGPGIPVELQERLFQPFERGPSFGEKQASGTGLGLAICRRLVHLMDGALGLTSRPGAGAMFWFELPVLLHQEEPQGLSAATGAESGPGRLNVLVAEDIEANRTVIGAMLQTLGHEAHMVEDGKEALAAALERDYDVILMDIQMPRMNGLDAMRAIRKHGGRLATVPIIAVTAFAQEDDRRAAKNAGADGYLTKPVRKGDLHAALEAVVDGRQAQEQRETLVEFDESAVNELREDLGEQSFVRLLGKCVEDVTERLGKLDGAAAANDEKQIRALAHQLKGLFAQFGATEAARAASEVETCEAVGIHGNLSALKDRAAGGARAI